MIVLLVLTSNVLVLAQDNTTARQEIIAIGGKFESPPYSDFVTIESYDLSTSIVTVFNTIYTQSVQDVLISGNNAYVTAQDSVVMYNIDTYKRLWAVKDSGVNKMVVYNNRLIITKKWPVDRFHVEVLDATNLSLIAFVDGIPGDCEGITVSGNHAYVAVDSGYQGVQGRLAVINTNNWSLDTIVNFGSSAIGIYSVYSYGGFIYCVDRTPYGGGNIGSITRYDPSTGFFTTNSMGVYLGPGYGISGNLLYLGMNNSIGSYDLDTQNIVDTTIITLFGSPGSIEIHSAAVDYLNGKLYTNVGDRSSFGVGVVYSLLGDSITSYTTGLNADACAIDFRTPADVASPGPGGDAISVYPNPAIDFIAISLDITASMKEIKILDITGRTIVTRSVQTRETKIMLSVRDFAPGVYLISLTTDKGTRVRKFIRR